MEEWPLQRYQPSIPLYGEAIDLGRMLLESILIGVNCLCSNEIAWGHNQRSQVKCE